MKITELGGAQKELGYCTSLRFSKEWYTPYSLLRGSFIAKEEIGEVVDAELWVDGKCLHKGLIDAADFEASARGKRLTVVSRGYTSLLAQNQLAPGFLYNISLNALMDSYIPLSYVGHESLSATVNYIYIKENTSMWEGITNLCLKQYGRVPFILGANTVRFNAPAERKTVALSPKNGNIARVGRFNDYTKMLSHYHMADTEGTYGTYNTSESAAIERRIIRHKQIALDSQWLGDPLGGLGYKLAGSMRGCGGNYAAYFGYSGEDLGDFFSYDGGAARSVSKIEIAGSGKGLITTLTAYSDKYNNV